jgi:hypothetical protein
MKFYLNLWLCPFKYGDIIITGEGLQNLGVC